MAPRGKEEDGVVVLGDENGGLSRSPPSFDTPSFIKSLSNLSLENVEESTPPRLNNESEESKALLSTSLELIAERGQRLLARIVNDNKKNSAQSLMVNACHSSLLSEFKDMLEEAKLLLNHLDNNGECCITSWRVSLAQIRADAYLERIETALDCPDSTVLDVELAAICNTITTQLSFSTNSNNMDVRISPWNLSSLAFDVAVASPIAHSMKSHGTLPLNIQVRAIQEVQAKDIICNGERNAALYKACSLSVERCVHEVGSFRAGAGSVGDVLLTLRVSPIESDLATTEECRPVVKEARK